LVAYRLRGLMNHVAKGQSHTNRFTCEHAYRTIVGAFLFTAYIALLALAHPFLIVLTKTI
jgi:hypothetical protein